MNNSSKQKKVQYQQQSLNEFITDKPNQITFSPYNTNQPKTPNILSTINPHKNPPPFREFFQTNHTASTRISFVNKNGIYYKKRQN